MTECITMRAGDLLKGVVKRERHTRKHGCYVLSDRHEKYFIVAQKLPALVAFLDSIAPDAASRVSLTALYQIQDTADNRVGGFSKHRWRLRFVPFDDVGALFERERRRFEHALIVGERECYRIERGASP